jgi:hypothetical protein
VTYICVTNANVWGAKAEALIAIITDMFDSPTHELEFNGVPNGGQSSDVYKSFPASIRSSRVHFIIFY